MSEVPPYPYIWLSRVGSLFLKITCWVYGTNPSTLALGRKGARAQQIDAPKWTETLEGARCGSECLACP